jgi:hypothetical protein
VCCFLNSATMSRGICFLISAEFSASISCSHVTC